MIPLDKVTVSCGCGRVMALDALRGRGAFRCGCGARIRLTEVVEPPRAFCAGTTESQNPCRFPVVHTDVAPLCQEHHDKLMEQAVILAKRELSTPDFRDEERILRERALLLKGRSKPELEVDEIQRRLRVYSRLKEADLVGEMDAQWIHNPRIPVVYFVRNGDQIKIGTTVDVPARMRALALDPKNVLATEPGSRRREGELHRRFAKHRIRSEWFHAAPEILGYIATLNGGS